MTRDSRCAELKSCAAMSDKELENFINEDDVGQHTDDSDKEGDQAENRTDEMTDDDATKSGEDHQDFEEEQADEVRCPVVRPNITLVGSL